MPCWPDTMDLADESNKFIARSLVGTPHSTSPRALPELTAFTFEPSYSTPAR